MLDVTEMNDLKLVIRHVHQQLQCEIGSAKNRKNSKTWPHEDFEREGDLASISSWYDSPFVEYRQVEFFFWQPTLICFSTMGLVLAFT